MGETEKAKVKVEVRPGTETKAKVRVKWIEQATPVVNKQQAVRQPGQIPTNKQVGKQLVLGLSATTQLVVKRFG